MVKPHSDWRRVARRVIAGVLASLPSGTPREMVRRAVSRAYPFGERAMHPYKIWLSEVKRALGGDPRKYRLAAAPPAFVFRRRGEAPWLDVECGWCEGKLLGGCLVCVRLHERLRPVVARPEWHGWKLSVASGDPLAPLVCADWLDDRNMPEAAALMRAWVPSTSTTTTEVP